MSLESLLAVPEIAQAIRTLQAIADDPTERERYEARVKFHRDQAARIECARADGRGEGSILKARETLLRLGRTRFGEVPQSVLDLVQSIDDGERLVALVDDVLDATDWNALFPTN